MNRRKCLTLLRREFHEHRMLWSGPLLAVVLLVISVFASAHVQSQGIAFASSAPRVQNGSHAIAALSLIIAACLIGAVTAIVAAIYAVDTLYSERKDRSILFWKSLPVSDAQTVLTKFAVAVIVLPMGTFLLALAVQPLLMLVVYLRYEPLHAYMTADLFAGWSTAIPRLMAAGAYAMLWYAPLATWLMLASVLSKRVPLMFAVLPVVLPALLETMVFGSSSIKDFAAERINPWPLRFTQLLGHEGRTLGIGSAPELWTPFRDPGLWIGLAVAAGMLYIIVRLRRFRDDT